MTGIAPSEDTSKYPGTPCLACGGFPLVPVAGRSENAGVSFRMQYAQFVGCNPSLLPYVVLCRDVVPVRQQWRFPAKPLHAVGRVPAGFQACAARAARDCRAEAMRTITAITATSASSQIRCRNQQAIAAQVRAMKVSCSSQLQALGLGTSGARPPMKAA